MKPEDMKDLRELIEFLKLYQVAEFDLDRGDLKIRLKFAQPEASSSGLSDLARLVANAPAVNAPTAAPASSPQAAARPVAAQPPSGSEAELHIVKSPIVGTFYGSPSPGAAPFVSPGDHVEKGQ